MLAKDYRFVRNYATAANTEMDKLVMIYKMCGNSLEIEILAVTSSNGRDDC
jgi:hypothetical protein